VRLAVYVTSADYITTDILIDRQAAAEWTFDNSQQVLVHWIPSFSSRRSVT